MKRLLLNESILEFNKKQIGLRIKVLKVYKTSMTKKSINSYPGLSFTTLAKIKKANPLPGKDQSNPGPP